MFRLIKGGKAEETKLEKRARALGQPQIQQWSDSYLNECGKALLAYTHTGQSMHLADAEEAVVALAVLIKELRSRVEGR